MKRLLQFSLLLNLVLLAAAFWRREPPAPLPRNLRTEAGEPAGISFGRARFGGADGRARTPWQAIEANDLARLIANLRAIGCPEQTIRDLVVFRVCRAYRQRYLELEEQAAHARDVTRNPTQRDWHERYSKQVLLRSEMIATVEAALGENWDVLRAGMLGWPAPGQDGQGALSVDQRRQIRDVEAHYSDLTFELRQKEGSGPDYNAQLTEIEAEKRAELAGVLSPADLQDYYYRHSPAADYVRQNLPGANSEAEFRTMVNLAAQYGMMNNQPGGNPGDDDPATSDFNARKAAFDQAMQATLGDDRIAEQKAEEAARAEQQRQQAAAREEESTRSEISDAATAVGIAPEDALRFFDRVKASEPDYKAKFDEMEKNLTGTPAEKQMQMEAAVKAEFEPIAVEMLGEKGRALLERMMRGH